MASVLTVLVAMANVKITQFLYFQWPFETGAGTNKWSKRRHKFVKLIKNLQGGIAITLSTKEIEPRVKAPFSVATCVPLEINN